MRHHGTSQELAAYIRATVIHLTGNTSSILRLDTLRASLDTITPGLGERATQQIISHALGDKGYVFSTDDTGAEVLVIVTASYHKEPKNAPPSPFDATIKLLAAIQATISPGETISNRNAKRLIRSNWMTPGVYDECIASLIKSGDIEATYSYDRSNRRRRYWKLADRPTQDQIPW